MALDGETIKYRTTLVVLKANELQSEGACSTIPLLQVWRKMHWI